MKKKILVNTCRRCKYWVIKLFYGNIKTVLSAKKNKKINIKKISFKGNCQYKLYNIP